VARAGFAAEVTDVSARKQMGQAARLLSGPIPPHLVLPAPHHGPDGLAPTIFQKGGVAAEACRGDGGPPLTETEVPVYEVKLANALPPATIFPPTVEFYAFA